MMFFLGYPLVIQDGYGYLPPVMEIIFQRVYQSVCRLKKEGTASLNTHFDGFISLMEHQDHFIEDMSNIYSLYSCDHFWGYITHPPYLLVHLWCKLQFMQNPLIITQLCVYILYIYIIIHVFIIPIPVTSGY